MAQRHELLRSARAGAAVLTVVALVLGACGGAAAPSPTPTTAAVRATLPPAAAAPTVAATTAPTTASAATPAPAAVVNVEAGENEAGFYLKADKLAIPGGKVTFNFANKGKVTHELMVYPLQDVTQLVAMHRADKKADEMALVKGMAAMEEDVAAGKSVTLSATLAPGFYELACHVRSKAADGSTFTHFDKGQLLTLAVTGAGGPAASVGTPAATLAVEMKGDEAASWLFVPDRIVVSTGEVAFKVTNAMKAEHDFVVHPLIDTTQVVSTLMPATAMPGMGMGGGHFDDWSMVKGTELFEDLGPGKTATKTLKLTPGMYVAACYMVSKAADGTSFIHRDRGQRIVFEVR